MANSVVFLCHSCCNAATLNFTLHYCFGEPILSVVQHAAGEHGEQRGYKIFESAKIGLGADLT